MEGLRSEGASDVIETLGPAGRAVFVAGKLEAWMKDEVREVDAALYGDATACVHYEPKGVVGQSPPRPSRRLLIRIRFPGNLIPFNFPFDLSGSSRLLSNHHLPSVLPYPLPLHFEHF